MNSIPSVKYNLLLLNGPNLNMLGIRQPNIYGYTTLNQIEKRVTKLANSFGFYVKTFQSNYEGAIIEAIHRSCNRCIGIIINPSAYSHTSLAIYDALSSIKITTVEVHLSNTSNREKLRHYSYISSIASVVISGAGLSGYEYAVHYLAKQQYQN